jgi:hypothetical protein
MTVAFEGDVNGDCYEISARLLQKSANQRMQKVIRDVRGRRETGILSMLTQAETSPVAVLSTQTDDITGLNTLAWLHSPRIGAPVELFVQKVSGETRHFTPVSPPQLRARTIGETALEFVGVRQPLVDTAAFALTVALSDMVEQIRDVTPAYEPIPFSSTGFLPDAILKAWNL